MFGKKLAATLALAVLGGLAQADTLEELAAQVRAQQAQIDALTVAVEQAPANDKAAFLSGTTLGGYGEANFSHLDGKDDLYDGYRFVLYLGHRFSDTVRLHSELEVEHSFLANDAGVAEGNGELELEQMYLEWSYSPSQRLSIGQILVPVGILNETHEPDTFYGVKRNIVEDRIIPTTWWEGGVKASGDIAPGVSYDLLLSSGLKTDAGNVRDGRQKGSKAVAEDYAYTGRVKYTGLKGLELGLSYQRQTDLTQGKATIGGADEPADLWEAHIAYQLAGFGLRALWAKWDIDGLASSKAAQAEQAGWYVEPSYKITEKLGVFVRYAERDNAMADTADSQFQQWNYGVNYYLAPRAVLKLDIQDETVPGGAIDGDGFLLGMGYSF